MEMHASDLSHVPNNPSVDTTMGFKDPILVTMTSTVFHTGYRKINTVTLPNHAARSQDRPVTLSP